MHILGINHACTRSIHSLWLSFVNQDCLATIPQFPYYIGDCGNDSGYIVEDALSDPDSLWIVHPQLFSHCTVRPLQARVDDYGCCPEDISGTSTFFLKIWEIPKIWKISQIFKKNWGNLGEFGPKRTREIICASEMRVTALRWTETCFRFFFGRNIASGRSLALFIIE